MEKIIHPLFIGGVELENNLILGPMAGVCDLPFRVLCTRQGAGMTCTEMVSAKAIQYNNKNTFELMRISPEEKIVSLQIFGSDPESMAEAAKRIEEIPFSILDINMGCPVPKVVNNGDGSALMNNPLLVGHIVEAVSRAIDKPVTVKIRAGFNEENLNAVEIAKIAQESGAAAVAVHGRTREQFYSGRANWDIIAQVKDVLDIPVIGNGDLTCGSDIESMYEQTGVDGFMIARASQGNPWIFSNILEGKDKKPEWSVVRQMILEHAKMVIELKGDYIGIREMRKHAGWYTVGYKNASKFRGKINQVESYDELQELLMNIEFI